MGVGASFILNYNAHRRGICLEHDVTDHLDDVSNTYADPEFREVTTSQGFSRDMQFVLSKRESTVATAAGRRQPLTNYLNRHPSTSSPRQSRQERLLRDAAGHREQGGARVKQLLQEQQLRQAASEAQADEA